MAFFLTRFVGWESWGGGGSGFLEDGPKFFNRSPITLKFEAEKIERERVRKERERERERGSERERERERERASCHFCL